MHSSCCMWTRRESIILFGIRQGLIPSHSFCDRLQLSRLHRLTVLTVFLVLDDR